MRLPELLNSSKNHYFTTCYYKLQSIIRTTEESTNKDNREGVITAKSLKNADEDIQQRINDKYVAVVDIASQQQQPDDEDMFFSSEIQDNGYDI